MGRGNMEVQNEGKEFIGGSFKLHGTFKRMLSSMMMGIRSVIISRYSALLTMITTKQ